MPDRQPLLIGLDVGSVHVKAALVTPEGRVLHVGRQPTPVDRSAGGFSGHPTVGLLAAAGEAIAECASGASGPIAGIGIASMSEAGTLIDRRGRLDDEIIPWFDNRSSGQAAQLESAVGASTLFATTGLRAHAKYSLPKLMWLAAHRPARTAAATAWAGVAELVGYWLTGALGTSASLACRTLAFDLATLAWSDDLLAHAGFSAERMPPVVPLGRPVGSLRRDVAARLGLESGIAVAIAGHDHLVGAFGAGVVEPGDALDSIGSAEACLVVTDRPKPDDALRAAGFSVGCHLLEGRGYVIAGLQSAGALIEWFLSTFLPDTPADERYASLAQLLARAPAGPGDIVVLPYLRGRTAPNPAPDARLVISGITEQTSRSDLAAGVIDGLACAAAWTFEAMEAAAHVRIGRLRLIGGGTRIERLVNAKAALAPARIERVETEEATALGAALVAGIACGVFESPAEALEVAAAASHVPRPPTARAYRRLHRTRFLPIASNRG